jgi:diguanylate cyclase (GGDEF)-like protein/PAS domain S-box-containing protein
MKHPAKSRKTYDAERFAQPADVLGIVLDHISQGMVVVGPDYRTLAFNRRFEEIFRLPRGAVEVGTDFRDILRSWARETGQDAAMLDRAIRELDLPTPFEFEFAQKIRGEKRWCLLTHNPIPGGGFVRTFTDITERKQLEERLLRQSKTDTLTGLDNRRAILDALDAELARSQRHERSFALLSLDIDHFKHVNDTWGHPVGDEVLRQFAAACRGELRKSDKLGRIGGEEFLAILPEAGASKALKFAERLRAAVGELRIAPAPGAPTFSITVSVGVTTAHATDRVGDLLQRVDHALYAAKQAGRNRAVAE